MKEIHRLSKQLASDLGIHVSRNVIEKEYPIHWHEFYELEYITEGEGEYIVDGTSYQARSGRLFFSTAVSVHEIRATKPIHTITIEFTEGWIEEGLFPALDRPCVIEASGQEMELFFKEYYSTDAYQQLGIRLKLNQLLLQICRSRTEKKSGDLQIVRRALTYIQLHFREEVTLGQLARQVGVSYHYLSRRFHESMGRTFKEYLNQLRVDYGAKLLINTNLSITEVSLASGFSSYSNFEKLFRQTHQCSPREYRNAEKRTGH